MLAVFGLHGVNNCESEGAYDEVRLFAESIGILRHAQVLPLLKVIEIVWDCYHFNYYKQLDFSCIYIAKEVIGLVRVLLKSDAKLIFENLHVNLVSSPCQESYILKINLILTEKLLS